MKQLIEKYHSLCKNRKNISCIWITGHNQLYLSKFPFKNEKGQIFNKKSKNPKIMQNCIRKFLIGFLISYFARTLLYSVSTYYVQYLTFPTCLLWIINYKYEDNDNVSFQILIYYIITHSWKYMKARRKKKVGKEKQTLVAIHLKFFQKWDLHPPLARENNFLMFLQRKVLQNV